MQYDLSDATAESVAEATAAAIALADTLVERATSSTDTTFAARIQPLDDAAAVIADAAGYGPFLSHFHPDKEVRDAGNEAEQLLQSWGTDLVARRDVYDAVAAVDPETLEGLERRSHNEWLRDLRRAGHELDEAGRVRVKDLTNRLTELQIAFARNLAESNDYIIVTLDDLEGFPKAYIDALESGDDPDTYKITLDYPAYIPFQEHAKNRDQRRELQFKYLNKARDANRPLLEEALTVRSEIAEVLGYADWAEFSMEPKMATPGEVDRLYESVIPGLTVLGRDEREKLESLLHADGHDGPLQPWDRPYYHTLQGKLDYGIDQNKVAEYFPLDAVIGGMLDVTGEVLGVTYTELPNHPTWHPDVRTFRIDDTDTGEQLAVFHLDLHPREGKFTHAACWNPVSRARARDGSLRTPVAAVAANFTKPSGETPSLLKHDEALTLWHEFGHVLHACLTAVDVQRFSGFDTEWDFVEAPSQIMENWMWNADVLRRFARHYETGEPIPEDLVEALVAARNQNIGLFTLRQVFLGKYDMMMHTSGPTPDLDGQQRVANEYTLLPLHEGTFMAAGFGHLMGGYDAGYYGYLWANVYGDDMFSVFAQEGVLSPAVGRRYRREVLEQGSSRDAKENLLAFLGREPNAEAFLAQLGITAHAAS